MEINKKITSERIWLCEIMSYKRYRKRCQDSQHHSPQVNISVPCSIKDRSQKPTLFTSSHNSLIKKKNPKIKQTKSRKPSLPFPVRTMIMKPSCHFQSANHQPLVFMIPKSCSSSYDIICLYSSSHTLLSMEGKLSCKIYEKHPLLNLFSGPLPVTIPWWCHDDVIY